MVLTSPVTAVVRSAAVVAIAMFLGTVSAPTAAQQTTLAHLRIGTPGGDNQAEAWYAQDQGFFRKYGLDADVQGMRGSGAGITAAVIGGAVDIGEADLIAISAARQHGIPLVVLAPSGMYNESTPTTALIAAKNATIRDGKSLEGTTIAVLSLEGPAKVAAQQWIDRTGGHSESVHYVEMPPSQMGDAVEHGTVIAATPTEPSLSVALAKTEIVAPVYSAIAPRFQISAWFATASWVKKNPSLARAFQQAIHDTAVWGNDPANHARSAEILAKYTKIPLARLGKMNRATYGLTYDPAMAQPLLDAAFKYHSLARPVSARELTQSS
jgi:NitT/TauT family transport system substrate-binding protein